MSVTTTGKIDRAAAYGDGVFETIAVRHGKARFLSAHIERLQISCTRLGLQGPSTAEIESLLDSELANNKGLAEFASAKLVVSAAASRRGYRRAGTAAIANLRLFAATPLATGYYANGVTARMCNTRLAVQPALAGIKSLNRLEQVLARAEWSDPNVFEGLTLDTDGRLICGTMSNVFIVNDSHLATPAITRCGVSGIMRAELLQRLERADVYCEVRDIDAAELATASELFLSNSQFGVLPVVRLDDKQLHIGDLTRQAQRLMAAAGVTECQA